MLIDNSIWILRRVGLEWINESCVLAARDARRRSLVAVLMLLFLVSMFWILITPGPGVLSLAGVGSAFGYRAGWHYGIGLFVGSNLVLLASAAGLGAVLETYPAVRIVFVLLSCGYLFYLASRIALTGSRIAFIEAASPPGFSGAVVLQIFNPKAYAVGAFVFSNFPFMPENLWMEGIIKLVVVNAVWIPIHIAWLFAGVSLRRLNLPTQVQRGINIAMALAMVIVVVAALWASGLI